MNITRFSSPFSPAYVEHQEEIIGALALTAICCCSLALIKKVFGALRRNGEQATRQGSLPHQVTEQPPNVRTPLNRFFETTKEKD